MTTITIPKKLTGRDELVVIPRKEYEKFLHIFKILPKSQWWFWTKEWQTKERVAEKDIALGKLSGPYGNKKELKKALDILKRSK